jgi:hypothetical protein
VTGGENPPGLYLMPEVDGCAVSYPVPREALRDSSRWALDMLAQCYGDGVVQGLADGIAVAHQMAAAIAAERAKRPAEPARGAH